MAAKTRFRIARGLTLENQSTSFPVWGPQFQSGSLHDCVWAWIQTHALIPKVEYRNGCSRRKLDQYLIESNLDSDEILNQIWSPKITPAEVIQRIERSSPSLLEVKSGKELIPLRSPDPISYHTMDSPNLTGPWEIAIFEGKLLADDTFELICIRIELARKQASGRFKHFRKRRVNYLRTIVTGKISDLKIENLIRN